MPRYYCGVPCLMRSVTTSHMGEAESVSASKRALPATSPFPSAGVDDELSRPPLFFFRPLRTHAWAETPVDLALSRDYDLTAGPSARGSGTLPTLVASDNKNTSRSALPCRLDLCDCVPWGLDIKRSPLSLRPTAKSGSTTTAGGHTEMTRRDSKSNSIEIQQKATTTTTTTNMFFL